jgi:hypothetical protein
LTASPGELATGVDALNAAFRAGKLQDVPPPAFQLPKHVDLGHIDALSVPRPEGALKELMPGILQGDIKSSVSDERVKRNTVMAECLSRLAANASGGDFSVTYAGKRFSSLPRLLGALKADGHQVTVSFDQRAANFSALKTRLPDGKVVDVPAPLMVRTGVKDPAGMEAVLPAAHGEMIIHIQPGGDTPVPGIEADLRFFQGISGTAFFPAGLWEEPTWCGRVTHDAIRGDEAWRALRLAGTLGDVINKSARDQHLWNGGYGETGVCNDSVAVIQQAVLGRTSFYPLLMRDELLTPELTRRLEQAPKVDDSDCRALLAAVGAAPDDMKAHETTRARALQSLPWTAGTEPFHSTVQARTILAGE